MNLTTEHHGDVAVVRVQEARMLYPILSDFASTVSGLVQQGEKKVLIDLTPVTYLDSATIGCLMDLYRQISNAGGRVKLSGVQKRVETMLTMTNTQNFIEVHPDAASALASFGA
jgi:anti-sigma B factor antagonist